MADSRSFVVDFGLRIFLPTLAAAAAITLLILYVFNSIFAETDTLDATYAQRSARAALHSLQDGLETTIQDNATWDDAVRNVYGTPNSAWLHDAWNINVVPEAYDAAFVADPADAVIFGSTREDPDNTARIGLDSYFGPDIGVLLDKLPRDLSGDRVSGLLAAPDGTLRVVAAANIIPSSDAVAAPAGPPRRLILARTISHALLAELSTRFALDNLKIVSADVLDAATVSMSSPSGQTLAKLSWSKRSPGAALKLRFGAIVWAVLTLFLIVVGILVYLSWRGFKQAHESKADAESASLRDELTGLANRRQLMKVLGGQLASAGDKELFSVVYADLDGFKEVNDAYGHDIGDQLLRAAAAGFAFLATGADLVARLGGDEFAIVVSGSDARQRARDVAHHMISFLTEPMVFGGRVASVSVSVGIVDIEPGDGDIEEVLRRADIAMYSAKSEGRNRVHVYDASMEKHREEARAIARDLRSAIDQRKLRVVYQPVVDARDRRILGVEALVRWPDDWPRQCPPDVFVHVAEEFGLIEDLGHLVMLEACKQAASWPDIFISVNVSPIQFMNPNFADIVERILRTSRLAPQRLEVEVTEGFIIDNAERASAIIGRLHDMRVSVALDDFGTGYSSIGHLRRFKFDKLKLDRSMVSDILLQPSALRLVQGTIAMADALGLRVTAEGIEDENQVSVLRLAGCSLFQGFLFSRPVEAREITALLAHPLAAMAG